jgi:hypothetical protein
MQELEFHIERLGNANAYRTTYDFLVRVIRHIWEYRTDKVHITLKITINSEKEDADHKYLTQLLVKLPDRVQNNITVFGLEWATGGGPLQSTSIAKKRKTRFRMKIEDASDTRATAVTESSAMRKTRSPAKRKADQQAESSAENADSNDDEDYSVEKFTGTKKMHACKLCDKQTTWISRHYRRSHDMSESVIHRFCRPFRYKGKILRILLIYFRSTVQ